MIVEVLHRNIIDAGVWDETQVIPTFETLLLSHHHSLNRDCRRACTYVANTMVTGYSNSVRR